MARRYALVVGIAQYKTPLKNLSKTATDAETVASVLEQHRDFQDVTLLKGEVTSAQFTQALRQLLLYRAKGNDALVYFTGHGIPVVDSVVGKPKGYLATSDCAIAVEGDRVVEQQRGIALDSLNELRRYSHLSSLVMLFNSYHSGDFLERKLVEPTFTAFTGRQHYYLIAACRVFEQAYAKKSDSHSIFTGALLRGLSNRWRSARMARRLLVAVLTARFGYGGRHVGRLVNHLLRSHPPPPLFQKSTDGGSKGSM